MNVNFKEITCANIKFNLPLPSLPCRCEVTNKNTHTRKGTLLATTNTWHRLQVAIKEKSQCTSHQLDFHVTVVVNRQTRHLIQSETMRFEAVLLLFFATAVVLECCCASPAAFGNIERQTEVDRVRRRTHTGTGTRGTQEEEEDEEVTTVAPTTAAININLLQLLQAISEFISRAGNAATNCVTQSCFPFDAGQCLTCLALVGLAAVGK